MRSNHVDYVIGLAKNERLIREIEGELKKAEEQFQKAIDLKQRLIVEIPDKPQLKEELAKFQSRLSALKAGPQNAAEPPAPNPAKSNSAPPQQKKD